MDTRTKIISLPQASALSVPGVVVTGVFDPLLPALAARLAALAQGVPLLVLVGDPPDPVMPQSARAELLAALRCVSHVVPLGEMPFAEAIRQFPHLSLAPLESFDLEQRTEFFRHVRQRHKSPVTS